VDGLVFSNNRLIRSYDFEPFHKRKAAVTLEACKSVRITGNRMEGDVLGHTVVLDKTAGKELQLGDGQGLRVE